MQVIHQLSPMDQRQLLYPDESATRQPLLYVLAKFILSRYDGHGNAWFSPKFIVFFQTIHAISSEIYRVTSQSFGGYNKWMLKRFEADKSPDVPIIDCSGFMINKRAKD